MRCAIPTVAPCAGVIHAQVIPNLADHDVTRVKSHPKTEIKSLRETQLIGESAQMVTRLECRVTRASSVVLVRKRRPEQGHDAVASVLIDRAFEAMHGLGQDCEVAF